MDIYEPAFDQTDTVTIEVDGKAVKLEEEQWVESMTVILQLLELIFELMKE